MRIIVKNYASIRSSLKTRTRAGDQTFQIKHARIKYFKNGKSIYIIVYHIKLGPSGMRMMQILSNSRC